MSATPRRCRECGCTGRDACVMVDEADSHVMVCDWAEDDLCSACIPSASIRWIHPQRTRRGKVWRWLVGMWA